MEKLPAGKVHDNAPGQCKWIDAKQQSDTTFAKSAEGGNDRSLLVTADNPVFSFHGHTGR
jgi:hypothetical protein